MPLTAILLFARTAEAEMMHKQLSPAAQRGKLLLQELQEHTLCAIRKTGLPFYAINETMQRGAVFGERLANAVADVLAAGFEQVIILGNDCPGLTAHYISISVALLAGSPLVAGRDQHGGVYLIGIHKRIFNRDTLAALRWQTTHLCHDLQRYHGTAVLLQEVLHDLNSPGDLITAAYSLPKNNPFRQWLLALAGAESYCGSNAAAKVIAAARPFRALRAPPAADLSSRPHLHFSPIKSLHEKTLPHASCCMWRHGRACAGADRRHRQ